MDPKDYRYTKDHEWVSIEGGIGTIGITNYAQEQLGDIVSVEFPKVGLEFSTGDSLALIDSMKTTSDLYAPVSGEVTEINSELEDRPELMNEDPLGEGWILRLRIKDTAELEGLLRAKRHELYSKYKTGQKRNDGAFGHLRH
jgi:glycine cleavage system H protein